MSVLHDIALLIGVLLPRHGFEIFSMSGSLQVLSNLICVTTSPRCLSGCGGFDVLEAGRRPAAVRYLGPRRVDAHARLERGVLGRLHRGSLR